MAGPTPLQQTALVVLRTFIGWHFLYEGYVKLLHPAWSRAGAPVDRFTSLGYLRAAEGPLAPVFHALANPAWMPWIDGAIAMALVFAGLSLMLGLFTQAGCMIAAALLILFYGSAIPLRGTPEPRAEGTYLFVNKNLIEAAAVVVLMTFRTGRIAGLDCLRGAGRRSPARAPGAQV
jgi:thiosulfate dehydrogenase (quinone) large subunit